MSRQLAAFVSAGVTDIQSCRFCCVGAGVHVVADAAKNEKFYLCEKHKKEYDLEADTIPAPVVEPAPEP